jgi:hypothetical protein
MKAKLNYFSIILFFANNFFSIIHVSILIHFSKLTRYVTLFLPLS